MDPLGSGPREVQLAEGGMNDPPTPTKVQLLRSEVQLAEGGMNDPPTPTKVQLLRTERSNLQKGHWVWNQGTAMSQQSQFCTVGLASYRKMNDIHSNEHLARPAFSLSTECSNHRAHGVIHYDTMLSLTKQRD